MSVDTQCVAAQCKCKRFISVKSKPMVCECEHTCETHGVIAKGINV